MAVDESVVAFWNWTRISLALEEEDEQKKVDGYSQDSDEGGGVEMVHLKEKGQGLLQFNMINNLSQNMI